MQDLDKLNIVNGLARIAQSLERIEQTLALSRTPPIISDLPPPLLKRLSEQLQPGAIIPVSTEEMKLIQASPFVSFCLHEKSHD